MQSARELIESFREVQFVPRDIAAAGDQVVATVEFRGTGRESGVEVRQTAAHVWAPRRIGSWHGMSTSTQRKASNPWDCRSRAFAESVSPVRYTRECSNRASGGAWVRDVVQPLGVG